MALFNRAIAILFALAPVMLYAQAPPPSQAVSVTADALAAANDPATGLFRGTGWWNSANGITALTNASRVLHTHRFDSLIANTFTVAPRTAPGFLNPFYDDEGWWALAWLDAYDLLHNPHYLTQSRAIFADMTGGWTSVCGGGIWWKKNEHYKNAIANELFLAVAVRLASASSGDARTTYLDWATREASWFLASGMVNSGNLVNDGLDDTCQNNQKTTWTYNQGVLLPALATLTQLTGEPSYALAATRIAQAAETRLVDTRGILHDPCEPNCGADGTQFKGIFVRNLALLPQSARPPATASFLIANASAVWSLARTPDAHFSVDWAGPPQDSGTAALISALDALTAPASLTPQP